MDKLFAIVKREYLFRTRSRAFIVWTLLSPLVMTVMMFAPILLLREQSKEYRVLVLDQSNDAALFARAAQVLAADSDRRALDKYALQHEPIAAGAALAARQTALQQQLRDGTLAGVLVLPPRVTRQPSEPLVLHTKGLSDFLSVRRIENAFNTALIERRMAEAGINAAQANTLTQRLAMKRVNERGEAADERAFLPLLFPILLVTMLMIVILSSGVMVMQGVIEEKQSRIIEVLLSSARPFEIMLGKLIGIGLVGLTQVTLWTLALAVLGVLAPMSQPSFKLPAIGWALPVFFLLFFVLGYFLYAALYVIVGAVVTRDEEAQQVQLPVMLLLMVPLMALMPVLRDPNGGLATALSFVPFFSPIVMLTRIAVQMPPWWQVVAVLLLMLVTILAEIWLAAKIYRVGVLMYGKPPTLPELARWLKYS